MDRAERRQRILECAQAVFAEKGYHRASISDIIARAGVARGTFYLYFKSKRAIFDQLLDAVLEMIDARIVRVDVSGGPARVLRELHANLSGVLDVLVNRPAVARILLHEAVGLDPGFDEKQRQFYSALLTLISESLELGQQMGLIRELDTELTARYLLGSMKELLFDLSLAGGSLGSVDHALDELLRFYLTGIARPDLDWSV